MGKGAEVMLGFLLTGVAGLVLVISSGWIFLELNVILKHNKKCDGMEGFLGTKKSSEEKVSLGNISIIRTKYEIPAGDALVKFIALIKKKNKTKAEQAFFSEMLETINSIETLGYSVERVVETCKLD